MTGASEGSGGGKVVWSASRLKKYLACPLQFRFSYVDGIEAVPTAPLALGRTLHEVIVSLHEWQMVEGELPVVGQVLAWFDAAWSDALENARPLFREGAPDALGCRTNGREMLRLYLAQQAEAPAPLAVGLAFKVHLEDFVLQGTVDRVDEGEAGLVVTDWKSGRKAAAAQVETDHQLSICAYAAEKVFREPVAQVAWHYLKDGSAQAGTRGEDDYRELTEELLPRLTLAVGRGEFEARSGYWCRWCDYRDRCPEAQVRPKTRAQGG